MSETNGSRQPDPRPIDRLLSPLRVFASHKLSGAILLLVAGLVAVLWANSPWGDGYRALLRLELTVGAGGFVLSKPLVLWINDGLMALFFFLVGLEIKREVLAGELASLRKAALPIAGALGGVLVPAACYLAFNAGGPGRAGWGVPMATDIAFALGVLAMLGDRAPAALRIFLTALAIVDDLVAIAVIAVFYTASISLPSLAIGALGVGASLLANRLGVRSSLFYFLLGTVVWLAFLKSGVHATLAAVLMAMTIPARTRIQRRHFAARTRGLLDALEREERADPGDFLNKRQQNLLDELDRALERSTAPLQRLEHALEPAVTYGVLPIFALANAGVVLAPGMGALLGEPVFWGILLGLVLGKQVGIFAASWLAVRLGLAELPAGVSWRGLHAVAVLGGVGFTMSLFIGGLAFGDSALAEVSKLAILSASLLAGLLGFGLLRWSRPTGAGRAELQ